MSAIKVRNPLDVAFGAYLKKERNALRTTSSEIAKGLHLGESLYRMIEAGSATLNINRLTYLIPLFENSKIIFERAAKFLTASQTMDFAPSVNRPWDEALQHLRDQDGDLEILLGRIRSLYSLEYTTIEYRKALDETVIPELELYLGNENYKGRNISELNKEAAKIFYGVPSLEIPNILSFLKSLNNRQPLHVGPIASEWEKENSKQFKSLRGIYKDHTIITSPENLAMFQYDYLLEGVFTSLRMIYIEDKLSSADIKDMFVEGLQKQREKLGKPLTKQHIKKIEIKVIKPNSQKTKIDIEQLLKSRDDVFPTLNAYWNFTHENGIEIGFVGGAKDANNYAINLSGQDALEKISLYEKVWNNI